MLFAFLFSTYKPATPLVRAVKYADDLTLMCFTRTASDDATQLEYDYLCSWATNCGMAINPSKTKVMDILSTSRYVLSPIVDNDTPLQLVDRMHLLGIILQSNLK